MLKKRFIAGAVCPRCGEMDKVITFERDEKNYRGCVACDFEEVQSDLESAQELPTRVNQFHELENNSSDMIQVVNLSTKEK